MQFFDRVVYLLTALIFFKLTTIVWRKTKQRFKEKKTKKGILWSILLLICLGSTFEGVIGAIVPPKPEEAQIEQKSATSSSKEEDEKSESTESTESVKEETQKEEAPKEEKKAEKKEAEKPKPKPKKKEVEKPKEKKKAANKPEKEAKPQKITSLPTFDGNPYVTINNNKPIFASADKTTKSFEKYSPLDALGRVGVAYANLGKETMSTEERGAIGHIKPTGWHTVRYSNVDGKYLYNRCHLIGYQLSAENDNERNLMTGTRYLNVDGMLPFENMVADYIKETGNHVLYRVTPYFKGDELVARGVQIEAESVEDKGKGISFNVYCFNNQPGVEIDYATGTSELTDPNAHVLSSKRQSSSSTTTTYKEESSSYEQETEMSSSPAVAAPSSGEIRGNSKSKIYHCPGQRDYENMADSKNLVIFSSPEEAEAAGYRVAKR